MMLNRFYVGNIGRPHSDLGIVDETTNTIVHELAHLEEHLVGQRIAADFWEHGRLISHTYREKTSHDQDGTFAAANRYEAGLWFAHYDEAPIFVGVASASVETHDGDKALLSSGKKGGIDLNPAALEIQTKGPGMNAKQPIFDPQNLEQFPLDGFSPVILQIVPISASSIPVLLGQKEPAKDSKQKLSSLSILGRKS